MKSSGKVTSTLTEGGSPTSISMSRCLRMALASATVALMKVVFGFGFGGEGAGRGAGLAFRGTRASIGSEGCCRICDEEEKSEYEVKT